MKKLQSLLSRGRFVDALKLAKKLSLLPGGGISATFYSAATRLAMGDFRLASELLRSIEPQLGSDPAYWAMRGDVSVGLRDFLGAVNSFDRSISLGGTSVSLRRNLANALLMREDYYRAHEILVDLLQHHPDSAETLSSQSYACYELELFEDARTYAERSISIEPGYSEAWVNLARALLGLRKIDAAKSACKQALRLQPNNISALSNLGVILQIEKDYLGARKVFSDVYRASKLPDDALKMAAVMLEMGDFKSGWGFYQGRKSGPSFNAKHRKSSVIRSLRDLSSQDNLIVYGEQGVGDQVLFLSCLPDLLDLVSGVALDVDIRLKPLLKSSFQAISFLDEVKDPELFSKSIALGDLPQLFRTSIEAFDARTFPYLRPSSSKLKMIEMLFPKVKPRVAISWRSQRRVHGAHKSVNLYSLLSAFEGLDLELINVQYGDFSSLDFSQACSDLGINGRNIEEFSVSDEFEMLAALLLSCDYVVSVSNSLLHLACALGLKAVGLIPDGQSAFWYWHRPLEPNPWYPNLFRIWVQQDGYFDPNALRESIQAQGHQT